MSQFKEVLVYLFEFELGGDHGAITKLESPTTIISIYFSLSANSKPKLKFLILKK